MDELEIIRHGKVPGLSLFLDTLDYRTPHFHQEWELVWVLDQPLTVTCCGQQTVLQPGQLVFFEPDVPHEYHKLERSSTFLCLQISPTSFPALEPLRLEGHFPRDFLQPDQLQRLKDIMAQTADIYFRGEGLFPLSCMANSLQILRMLLTNMPSHTMTAEERAVADRHNARLKRLIRFVDDHYMHKLSLSDFAKAEGCTVGYLSHFIRAAMNQTFREYVQSVRFHCACRLIAQQDRNLLDVCMESGFSDYRYFSRAFKAHFAMTPEQYRLGQHSTGASAVRRSLHSVERFYTPEESLQLLAKLKDA